MSKQPHSPPTLLIARFTLIMSMLLDIVVTQGHAENVPQPRIMLIWQRLQRLAARFIRAATHGPAPRRRSTRAPQQPRPRPELTLPKSFGWLPRLFPGVRRTPAAVTYPAQQLRDLLADPDMADLIETNPTIGRTLRPLFTALGLEIPAILEIPPPQPDPPPPPAPSQPPAPEPPAPSPPAPGPHATTDPPNPTANDPARPSRTLVRFVTMS